MEEGATEIKASRIPKIDKIINYKDFFGEYPIIFAIKIISSLSLIYVISEFYVYHMLSNIIICIMYYSAAAALTA